MSPKKDARICGHQSGSVVRRVGISVEHIVGCDLPIETAMFLQAAGSLVGLVFKAGTGMHGKKDDRATYCSGCLAKSAEEASNCAGFVKPTNES